MGVRRDSQHLPLSLQVWLPPVLVAIAGAVAALTPKSRMIAANRMRIVVAPSRSLGRLKRLSTGRRGVKTAHGLKALVRVAARAPLAKPKRTPTSAIGK